MTVEYTQEELLQRALDLLSEQFDIDVDTFFLIVTKDAHAEDEDTGTQIVVGELETRAVLTFIIHAIEQISNVNGMTPYAFISRFILGHFINEEKQREAMVRLQAFLTEPDIGLEDPDAEKERQNALIYNEHMLDIEN